MTVSIRPIRQTDLDLIKTFEGCADLETYFNADAFWGFVAEQKDVICGVIFGWRLDLDVEVIQITIDPDYRRGGIGMALLSAFINNAKAEQCRLELRSDNDPALNLYRKLGFKEDGIRKAYYFDKNDKKVDAILMSYHAPQDKDNNGEEN